MINDNTTTLQNAWRLASSPVEVAIDLGNITGAAAAYAVYNDFLNQAVFVRGSRQLARNLRNFLNQ